MRRAHDVAELSGAVEEARRRPPGGPVLERELDLGEPQAGPQRVDGHRRLHAEAGGEGKHRREGFAAERALAGEGGEGPYAPLALDRPPGGPEHEADAAAHAAREPAHHEVGLAALERPEQGGERAGRGPEVGVAEHDEGAGREGPGAERGRAALPRRASRGHHRRAVRAGHGGGRVRGAVVRHHDVTAGEGVGERVEGGPQPIGLVARRHEDRGGTRAGKVRASAHPEVAVTVVQAQITGTVWRIACEVGQTVQEGDPLVIIESMKMEMPVEAEESGVVAEILCHAGQAVARGETLVVLAEPHEP